MRSFRRFPLLAALSLGLIAATITLSGCFAAPKPKPTSALENATAQKSKMLHLKQVLDRYDASGQPVPQYYELWIALPKGLAKELDSGGKTLSVALDTGSGHIQYDAVTMEARKSDITAVFYVNFESLKSAYAKTTAQGKLDYAGRRCISWLMENTTGDDWAKAYVDEETGWVLLCDAPLFRLRTASFELVAEDAQLFTAPDGLKYK